ncbi:MAG: vancomycin high temperature exclusion protein [Acutalibacteraceae bacterium]|nr:ElyC/SanA/YdcF family protein [Oscillospiraceae bacterium]
MKNKIHEKKVRSKKKKLLEAAVCLCAVCVLGLCAVFGVNGFVIRSARERLITPEEAAGITDADCILVLGCGVRGDQPSPMLNDRLERGVELYKSGAAPKLLMSGDHGRKNYDEVNVMKKFAVDESVESSDVFMDHAGFSTYDSIYRAKEIFKVRKMIIVTQEYHLYRALYIAEKLGLEAYGVTSDQRQYAGQFYRDVREILARDKDFVKCIVKPAPTCLGEAIPVNGNGDLTNDKS